MAQVEHYQKGVITVATDAPVREAAECMLMQGVGCVVVLAEDGHPVGVVTDRDLAVRVVAAGREAGITPVSAVMTHPVVTASPSDPIERVVEVMQSHGVRRVPVIGEKGVVGLVSLDDLLVALSGELRELGEAARREVRDTRRAARVEHFRRELRGTFQELEETFQGIVHRLESAGGHARERLVHELDAMRERIRKLVH
jgi:CBS domain-containing protein